MNYLKQPILWIARQVSRGFLALWSALCAVKRLVADMNAKVERTIDRYGEEIEENATRQLPYSEIFRGFLRDMQRECRQLPKEGFLLLTSVVTVFGFLDFIGYESSNAPIKLVLYEFGRYQDIMWAFILAPLHLEPGPLAKYLFTLQFMFCVMNIRGAAIVRAAGDGALKLNTVHDQKKYLALLWLCACTALFLWLSFYTLRSVDFDPSGQTTMGAIRYTIALVSTVLAILLLVLLACIALFLSYLLYYKYIYKLPPMNYARDLAVAAPIKFLLLNLAYILGMCVYIFLVTLLSQESEAGTIGIRNWLLVFGLFLYFSVWSIAFFAAISVPRVVLAVTAVMAALVLLDKLIVIPG